MVKVLAEGFNGVEIIFTQGKSACRGGSPGIHERHLHYVIFIVRAADVRPAILHMNMDLRLIVKMKRVIGVASAHYIVGDCRVDLDSRHIRAAVGDSAHYVHTAARADDGEVAMGA